MFSEWTERFQRGPLNKKFSAVDLAVLLLLVAGIYGIISVAAEWGGPIRRDFQIDLSPSALPHYAMLSVARGLVSYVISLIFSLAYGYWAAKSPRAEVVLIPILDILQGIPILGFLPGLVITFVSLFPNSNVGLEIAAILAIFTSQAWNMTFSFYSSVKSVPQEMREVASLHKLTRWQVFKNIETPMATIDLVWNSMVSMAGGWFFLIAAEALKLGDFDFRLPGIGSYMSVAIEKGDYRAMTYGLITMAIVIVVIDQLLWRPLFAWAYRFRHDDANDTEQPTSIVLRWLRRSEWAMWVLHLIGGSVVGLVLQVRKLIPHFEKLPKRIFGSESEKVLAWGLSIIAILITFWGGSKLFGLVGAITLHDWGQIVLATLASLSRVTLVVVLTSLWAIPVGIAIGRRPKMAQKLQPIIQMTASYPASMVFPLIVVAFSNIGVSIEVSSVLLMMLASQWYLLFNVIGGTTQIPPDMIETALTFNLSTREKLKKIYLPAIFPHLVTGWITVAGGAWNATIISEYINFGKSENVAFGLGGLISVFAAHADYARLAASIVVMALTLVILNRTLWASLYDLAHRRYRMER